MFTRENLHTIEKEYAIHTSIMKRDTLQLDILQDNSYLRNLRVIISPSKN